MSQFPFTLHESFTTGLGIGCNDRGLGRHDFAILHKESGAVIAKLESVHLDELSGTRHVELLPFFENAHLFAAAPDLFGAAKEAYVMLQAFHMSAESEETRTLIAATMKRLEEALTAAVPKKE